LLEKDLKEKLSHERFKEVNMIEETKAKIEVCVNPVEKANLED